MLSKLKLKFGLSAQDCTIELNGAPLPGVRRVSFDLDARNEPVVRLEIMGEVFVEGEFIDEVISATKERPARVTELPAEPKPL